MGGTCASPNWPRGLSNDQHPPLPPPPVPPLF
jgi:hypothetical protein